MSASIDRDVSAVARIDVVPTILSTVCLATGMGFAAVARVTDEKWVACSVRDEIRFGLEPGGELPLETTICHEIRQSAQAVIISDVAVDPDYCGHHTPAMYGFRSYISVPIVLPDGQFFGTLCAIDPEPRDLARPETYEMFCMFAQIIAVQLDQANRLAGSIEAVAHHRSEGELREQFIAVLGHDLRNPLANVQAGVTLLRRGQPESRALAIYESIQSSIDRMARMVDNILDFARGRLGGGLTLDLKPTEIDPLIEQVVSEIQHSHLDRRIDYDCASEAVVNCDRMRISQLVSNLVGNAVAHGSADAPVTVHCGAEGGDFLLTVTNGGDPIAPAALERLFHPFARGEGHGDSEGLGLGLYIASEIATAHGGELSVASDETETRFAFRLPAAVD